MYKTEKYLESKKNAIETTFWLRYGLSAWVFGVSTGAAFADYLVFRIIYGIAIVATIAFIIYGEINKWHVKHIEKLLMADGVR